MDKRGDKGMKNGGFLAGAVGGLALALLVVGLAFFVPQSNSPLLAASTPQVGAQSVTTLAKAPASSTTANGSSQFVSAPPGEVAGIAPPASASSNTTAASASAESASSSVGNRAQGVTPSKSGTQGQQKPSSFLAVLPGESVGSAIATVSPLLIGFLVAALVYGAYVRRQDSSS